ncbi:MAG: aminotransferase class I/II-fold pyridoxal phosphate-dependent enzyme [Clostridiales bacterium]|nr:aminotransferase class I/II-fold pyridoxal phosphate-dependent enzyme [Clostridiales bacterium]
MGAKHVLIINLLKEDILDEPNGEKATSQGENDWWASCRYGYIDPRPRRMSWVQDDFNRILQHGGVFIIFADEIYDRLVMDDREHIAIASLAPDLMTVSFNGLSKSHRIAGFRVGWMCLCGDKSKAQGYIEGLNMLSSMRLCSNVPAQQIIQTALGGYQSADELLLPGGRLYEQREYITNRLNSIPGISAVKPKAAFYIFPKIDTKMYHIKDDEKFALDFLKEQHVLLVHGGGFNWTTPDHFRIVYLPRLEELKIAMDRFELFLSTYRG